MSTKQEAMLYVDLEFLEILIRFANNNPRAQKLKVKRENKSCVDSNQVTTSLLNLPNKKQGISHRLLLY